MQTLSLTDAADHVMREAGLLEWKEENGCCIAHPAYRALMSLSERSAQDWDAMQEDPRKAE